MSFITNYFHAIFLILIINFAFFTINEVHPSEYKFSILQIKAPCCSKLRSFLCFCSASSKNEESELPNQNEGARSGSPVLLSINLISNTGEGNSGDSNSNENNPNVGKYSGFTNTRTVIPPSDPDPPQFIHSVRDTTTTTTKETKTTSNDS
ncbi:Signal peptide containing protein [Cryptosporidium tyzzeri]|nr:Signal peptide containing protein [Cryptosporidium tyzzeri]